MSTNHTPMNRHPKDFIIFPLDVPTLQDARHFVRLLRERVGIFKIGLELFIHSGPEVVQVVKDYSSVPIFLDLKLHDIPITVARAMAKIGEMGVHFATVHCGEASAMLADAVRAGNGKVKVLGVTLLTSVAAQNLLEAGYKQAVVADPMTLVVRRALMASKAGCSGVVCSAREVHAIKEQIRHDFLVVTPGIRPAGQAEAGDDQQRIGTPGEAIGNGADYLVIGRPIRDAADPAAAAEQIAEEIGAALER